MEIYLEELYCVLGRSKPRTYLYKYFYTSITRGRTWGEHAHTRDDGTSWLGR